MSKYYELMVIIRKDGTEDNEFESETKIATAALNEEIDTESETVATAIGVIRWLLKNDESVKGKYSFRKKK